VEIPTNTTATVYVPAKDGSHLLESGQPMTAQAQPGYLVVNVGSGIYHFSTVLTQP